jgi:hypothetical protein
LLKIAFDEMDKIPGFRILADNTRERLGVISFYFDDIHYNLVVKLLNDRYGIQVREVVPVPVPMATFCSMLITSTQRILQPKLIQEIYRKNPAGLDCLCTPL